MTTGAPDSFTVKEILLQVSAKVDALAARVDAYIQTHEARHAAETALALQMAAEPAATPAGKQLVADVAEVRDQGNETREAVERHERLIQRLIGAVALATIIGLGDATILTLRVAHLIP